MKIIYELKNGKCLTLCEHSNIETVYIGSIGCKQCNFYIDHYVKDGKNILECKYKNEKDDNEKLKSAVLKLSELLLDITSGLHAYFACPDEILERAFDINHVIKQNLKEGE